MPEAQPLIDTDAVVVGAGPVGLFQAFQLGLLELSAHLVDALPYPGGQCIELYPDKPIYDVPGVPVCTGRELVESLGRQLRPFDVPMHLGQEVAEIGPSGDGRFLLGTAAGTRFRARTLVIAAGAGAFQPRRLKLDGLETLDTTQVAYHVADPAVFAGRRLAVVGGGEAALEQALRFAESPDHRAGRVTLIHRRDVFQAPADRIDRMRALVAAGSMDLVIGQVTGFDAADGRLRSLDLTLTDGSVRILNAEALLVFFGLSPKLGPVADWGLAMERKQLSVDPSDFRTSVPGIFAVGDINTYPGKKKLLVSGFHECALAAFGAARHIQGREPLLQYTTTSSRLHALLGVDGSPRSGSAG
jgi:thioredoxin reductase (NADPH)